MKRKSIWVNTVVYNEENFIWFSIMSVVDYVDKVLVWDTGSTDNTVDIIKDIQKKKGDKIDFREVGKVDDLKFSLVRQKMLEASKCDWILILDGDEIWLDDSIKKVAETINKEGDNLDALVVPFYNLVGDVYHYQEEAAGNYQILDKKGHLTIRAINRNIPGLHIEKPYGNEGFYDGNGQEIHQRDKSRLLYLDASYLHATHLIRSSKGQRIHKVKYELGIKFPTDFKYPSAFYKPFPEIVRSPFIRPSGKEKIRMFIETPLRIIKRRLGV